MNCDRMLEGNTIVKIERSGILIGVVKDRRAIKQAKCRRTRRELLIGAMPIGPARR